VTTKEYVDRILWISKHAELTVSIRSASIAGARTRLPQEKFLQNREYIK